MSLCTLVETNVNKFAISNHADLKLHVHALSEVNCKYEFYFLPNRKVNAAEDHGENYIKDRPPLVRHLLRNGLSHLM